MIYLLNFYILIVKNNAPKQKYMQRGIDEQ